MSEEAPPQRTAAGHFLPGAANPRKQGKGGRQPGTPNKRTATFKEAISVAYDAIGGHEAFAKWAKLNQTEFYKIAARLIPTEISGVDGGPVIVEVVKFSDGPQ